MDAAEWLDTDEGKQWSAGTRRRMANQLHRVPAQMGSLEPPECDGPDENHEAHCQGLHGPWHCDPKLRWSCSLHEGDYSYWPIVEIPGMHLRAHP